MLSKSIDTINYFKALNELFHESIKIMKHFKSDKYMTHSELDVQLSSAYKRIQILYFDECNINISRIPLHMFSKFLENDISLVYHFYNLVRDLNFPKLNDFDVMYHVESNRFNFIKVLDYTIYMGNSVMSINLPCYEVLKKMDGFDLPCKTNLGTSYFISCVNSNIDYELIKFAGVYRLRRLYSNLYYTLLQERKIYGN